MSSSFARLTAALLLLSQTAYSFEPIEKNLAYRSPFAARPQLGHNLHSLKKRYVEDKLAKRQVVDSTGFKDDHYPTFYGSDFSNVPLVWSGGLNFTHSVASGDPFDTSVLLWTRAIPATNGTSAPDQSEPACVSYKVSTSPTLSGEPIASGQAFTSYDIDWTVKVEATGLQPDAKYFYQFADCTNPRTVSPIGTTRTISSPDTPAQEVNGGKPLTLAVFSCSQYQAGWFNAYGYAAQNTSPDLFVHLGDYIYESLGNGAKIGRQTLGRELATIRDYRQRLNQYRTDASLVIAHQSGPWITVWDDHEVADNSWKAGTADSNDTAAGCSFSPSGACFTDRKLAAVRAYHEWMPIRQVDPDDQLRIWRNFQIGKLIDLTMLDTRNYDRDLTDVYYNTEFVNTIAAFNNRSLMGARQEQWLYNTLSESKSRGATWRIIGQQVIFTQLDQDGQFNLDAWDGYRANRARVLEHLYGNNITNTVILAGDSHANWVSDLARPNDTTTYNPTTGVGAIGVEFAGTAVTSGSSFGSGIQPAAADVISKRYINANPDLQWSEGSYRGFFTLTVGPNALNATYYAMRNTSKQHADRSSSIMTDFIGFANIDGFASSQFVVKAGENRLSRPVAGGKVLAGVLKSTVNATNTTTSP